jgi:hypothetical protein
MKLTASDLKRGVIKFISFVTFAGVGGVTFAGDRARVSPLSLS